MSPVATSGRVLDGKYTLRTVIGSGRFGTVYRATHIALQKPVAVKVLHASHSLSALDFERFRVEAEALGRLEHPHIVRVTDFGIDPDGAGVPYLVMELVDGRPLDEQRAPSDIEGLARVAGWLTQIADALEHARAAGVTHGDLSGRNVLVSGDGAAAVVKVIDFGLAGLALRGPGDASLPDVQESADGLFQIDATPECAAPERLRGGPPTPAADVYALAALAYRLVTGHYPFEGPPRDVVRARLTSDAPPPSSLQTSTPRALDAVIRLGLAARASDRPASATALALAFAEAVRLEARRRWRRRETPRRLAVAGGLAVVLAGMAPWIASHSVVQRMEGTAEDVRFALSAPRTPDERLLLVALDNLSLEADSTPLPDQAAAFAATLTAALAQGASAAAFDLLLPQEWARAPQFGEFLARHSDRVVLALAAGSQTVTGVEAVDPLVAAALGPEATSGLFALVTHAPAPDGVVRRARAAVLDVTGAPRPTLAGRVAALIDGTTKVVPGEPFIVDYRVEASSLSRIGWHEFARAVHDGARFDGRALIVGADFTGSGDRHRVPGPRRLSTEISGLALQGLAANTLVQPGGLRDAPPAVASALAGIATLASGLSMLGVRRLRVALLGAGGTALVAVLTVQMAWAAGLVVPVVAPVASCLLGAMAAAGFRRQWSEVAG